MEAKREEAKKGDPLIEDRKVRNPNKAKPNPMETILVENTEDMHFIPRGSLAHAQRNSRDDGSNERANPGLSGIDIRGNLAEAGFLSHR